MPLAMTTEACQNFHLDFCFHTTLEVSVYVEGWPRHRGSRIQVY